jgi:hypothetical protein
VRGPSEMMETIAGAGRLSRHRPLGEGDYAPVPEEINAMGQVPANPQNSHNVYAGSLGSTDAGRFTPPSVMNSLPAQIARTRSKEFSA